MVFMLGLFNHTHSTAFLSLLASALHHVAFVVWSVSIQRSTSTVKTLDVVSDHAGQIVTLEDG